MLEIFQFYSCQHRFGGGLSTFEEIKQNYDHLNISEFMKFCQEFNIPVKREVLNEVYKKTATFSNKMNYDQFLVRKLINITLHLFNMLI